MRKKTPAEKAHVASLRRSRKEDYSNALAEARDMVMEQAVQLRERFGGHSVEYYYEEIMQRSRAVKGQRRITQWNAYLAQEIKRINEGWPIYKNV